MRRSGRLLGLTAAVAGLSLGTVPPAGANAPDFYPYTLSFDWSYGLDVAIGVPGEDTKAGTDAGAVEVRYNNGSNAQVLTLPGAHGGDRFGAALAAGKINGDRYDDLAVGVPGRDVGGKSDAGAVAFFYGSASGLHFAKLITQSTRGVPGAAQAGAHFGATLAFSFPFFEVKSNLRIGEPDKDVGSAVDAGGYVDLVVGSGSSEHRKTREVTLATRGIPGSPGTGDHLGAALYRASAVGAPGRTVNGRAGAGAVLYTNFDYSPPTLITEATKGVPGTAEAGDNFGAALAFGLIGVPGESVGSLADAGAVVHVGSTPESSFQIIQGQGGVPGTAKAGNRFGSAIDDVGVIVDESLWAPRRVFIGAPGDDSAGPVDSGSVTVLGISYDPDGIPYALTGVNSLLHAAKPVAGAAYGSSIARLDDIVLVGSPSAGAGSVTVFETGSGVQVTAPPALADTWTQHVGKRETGDGFGAAFAHAPN